MRYKGPENTSSSGWLLIFPKNVARHVKEGPKPEEHTQRSMDFAAYGAAMRDAQSDIDRKSHV